jgi:hypothetical protein
MVNANRLLRSVAVLHCIEFHLHNYSKHKAIVYRRIFFSISFAVLIGIICLQDHTTN